LYEELLFAFKPTAVVVQCGADSLALDPLGGFNLGSIL
jgi:acetoin utilization deacetylase AcuC-like enzyme